VAKGSLVLGFRPSLTATLCPSPRYPRFLPFRTAYKIFSSTLFSRAHELIETPLVENHSRFASNTSAEILETFMPKY